jgi:hypothetical protein
MKVSELELDLGTVSMHCTTAEIARTLEALLGEMRMVIPKLRRDEREVLRRIMAHESGTLTVADVFPDFGRESEGHKTLRRFRAAQFIRPANTGRWDPDEPIEVKPFARLMWDRVGEAEIFGEAQAEPELEMEEPVVADEAEAGEEERADPTSPADIIALAPADEPGETPADDEVPIGFGGGEPNDAETAADLEKRAAAALWDDDDVVLDLSEIPDEEVKGKA